MTATLTVVVAAGESLNLELLRLLGGGAAAFSVLGLLLLLPIYLTHRREVQRLLEWKDRNPDAGTTEFRAVPSPGTSPPPRSGGRMTPAERVTSERPALTRISTGEYAAIEPERPSFLRRVVERGPRHPLVLTLLAVAIGVAVFVVASQLIRSSDEGGGGKGGVDPAAVAVVVVNATAKPGTADDVADLLSAKGFVASASTAAADVAKQSSVFYGKGRKQEGKAVPAGARPAFAQPLPIGAGGGRRGSRRGGDRRRERRCQGQRRQGLNAVSRGSVTGGTALGAALFAALAVLAIAGFAITLAARAGDDLVNSVQLEPELRPGGQARVAFTTTEADDSVDVLIIDGEPGGDDAQVRALALGEDLPAGEHAYRWDGLADDGEPAPSGAYALRVVLGEAGRDILPPGRIEVTGAAG